MARARPLSAITLGFAGCSEYKVADSCLGSDRRYVSGDLDLSAATPEDLGSWRCLRSVEGKLILQSNPALTDLSGLESLEEVGEDLSVHDNPLLCEDEVDDLFGQLTYLGGSMTNAGNEGACP